jgi:response regulator of citrate/malate metabolism
MTVKRVLIVEDDFMLGLINKKYIELMGHEVAGTATSSEEAIRAARELKPDVILMDIRLEGRKDGIETMAEIAKFANIPVIYLSGNSDPENRMRAAQTNMLAFCVKPVHFEQLQECFSRLP